MTELPPELTTFGLGPRTFKRRTNERSKDRSDWTDTPADKEKKARVSIICHSCCYFYVFVTCSLYGWYAKDIYDFFVKAA